MRTLYTLLTFLFFIISGGASADTQSYRGGYVYLPNETSSLVKSHLQAIVDKGWAKITPGDLYHAHILMAPNTRNVKEFGSPEELLSRMVGILYHSDEMLFRWRLEDGDLSLEQRRPRSIIGYLDGTVAPAVGLLPEPLIALDYEWSGTIHPDDLATAQPKLFDSRRNISVHTSSGSCLVNLQIDIGLSHGHEPLIVVNDTDLKITLDCMNPAQNQ